MLSVCLNTRLLSGWFIRENLTCFPFIVKFKCKINFVFLTTKQTKIKTFLLNKQVLMLHLKENSTVSGNYRL